MSIEKSGFHYFVSSFAGWATAATVKQAIKKLMDCDKGCRFPVDGCNVFLVPVSEDEKYEINFYQPQVKDVQFCGYYNYKSGFEFEHLLIEAPDAEEIEVEEVESIEISGDA